MLSVSGVVLENENGGVYVEMGSVLIEKDTVSVWLVNVVVLLYFVIEWGRATEVKLSIAMYKYYELQVATSRLIYVWSSCMFVFVFFFCMCCVCC